MAEGGAQQLIPCLCKFCLQAEPNSAAECVLEKRVKQHMSDVAELVNISSVVKLIVGPDKTEISCHKLLLSFYSSAFDKYIYGASKGIDTSTLHFPALSAQEMSAFVTWSYTGRLDRKVDQRLPCLLWTFGKKLGAPLFVNDAMQLLSDNIRVDCLKAATADFAFAHIPPSPKLRLFIAEYITHANPLCPSLTESWAVDRRRVYRAGWIKLIEKGGALMRQVAALGLHNANKTQALWRRSNFPKFLEMEPDRSPSSWNRDKMAIDAQRQAALEMRQHAEEEQRGIKRASGAGGVEEQQQLASKRNKEADERMPSNQEQVKDGIPARRNDQTPARHNGPAAPTRQKDQAPDQTPFRAPLGFRDTVDPASSSDEDTPLRLRRAARTTL